MLLLLFWTSHSPHRACAKAARPSLEPHGLASVAARWRLQSAPHEEQRPLPGFRSANSRSEQQWLLTRAGVSGVSRPTSGFAGSDVE